MLLSHRAGAGIAGTACGTARSQCTASCSGRQHAQPTQRAIRPAQRHGTQLPPANPTQRQQMAPCRPALAGAGLAADMSFGDVDEDEGEEEFDYTAVQVADQANINPDFFDEHWADKVSDWYEFWHYQDWDHDDLAEELDDEHDAVASLPKGQDWRAVQMARNQRMMSELQNIEKYEHAVRVLGPVFKGDSYNAWDMQPVPAILPDPNPEVHTFDLRAMVEKRKRKELMDKEWKRRQALVGRVNGVCNVEDMRLYGWLKDDWTDEQIQNLITGDGAYARPEDVLAYIDNPLLNADYPNTYGVEYVPDTVEFIDQIGHLMHDDEISKLDGEVTFEEQDFVDPKVIFRDEEGNLHMDAPVNPWSALERGAVAADMMDLDEMEAEDSVEEDLELDREDEAVAAKAKKEKKEKKPPAAGKKRGRKKKDEMGDTMEDE